MMQVDVVEGQTAPIDVQLTNNALVPNLSGTTPGLELRGADGVAVDTTGKIAWVDATVATVRFTPAAGDLLASKSAYTARWTVTDVAGKRAFFPDDDPDKWICRKVTV